MMGNVDVIITADFIEIAIVALSEEPAASPTIDVPFTIFRKNSITGNCDVFK